jgi:hypothetical protein
VPARGGQGPEDGGAGQGVGRRVGEVLGDGGEGGVVEPRGQHRGVRVGRVQRREDLDDLVGGLAGTEDDLRVARPGAAVDVDAAVAEVDGRVGRDVVHGTRVGALACRG